MSAPWLKECAWVLTVMLGTLPIWWLAHLAPSNEPPPLPVACGLGLLLGAVQVWFVPYANSFCSGEVRVMESHLMRSQGNSHRRILWIDVREVCLTWQEGSLIGTAVPINPEKQPLRFVIPTRELMNEFVELLRKLGVPVREVDEAPSEDSTPTPL